MSNSVEDIRLELEHTFLEPSIKNSVRTSDGEIVRLPRAIWTTSPVLVNNSEEGSSYVALCVPKRTVDDLLIAHRDGTLSASFSGMLNLLAVARQLMLGKVLNLCLDALYRDEHSFEADYPSECSSEVVMLCFSVLLDSPLRTADIYEQQLRRIEKHSNQDEGAITNAMNLIKQKLQEYENSSIGGIPVGFERRTVPVVIFKEAGECKTAIVHEDKLVVVNLLGRNFRPGEGVVEDFFYLKYASYVLYKSGRSVYLKSLQDESDPEEKLQDCHHILTRGEFVFAMQVRGEVHSLLQWLNDEKFVEIYQSGSIITMVDFQYTTRLLAIGLRDYSFQLFSLENATLTLLQEQDRLGVSGKKLPRQKMLVILLRWCFKSFWAHGIFSLHGEGSIEPDGVPVISDKKRIKFLRDMKYVAGSFFHYDTGALQLVKNPLGSCETKTVLSKQGFYALSELCLAPS